MERKHVLCISFPIFGHIIPLLELAKKLCEFHDVTFAVSASRAEELKIRNLHLSSGGNHQVHLYGIQDGVTWADPDPSEGANPQRMAKNRGAMKQALESLLRTLPVRNQNLKEPSGVFMAPVDVIFFDCFLSQDLAPGCVERGLPYFLFNSANAHFPFEAVRAGDHTLIDPQINLGTSFARRPDANGNFIHPIAAMKLQMLLLPVKRAIPMASGLIMNSYRDFEEKEIAVLENAQLMRAIPVHCVGPLIPKDEPNDRHEIVIDFLNLQNSSSVIYVAFGSMAALRPEQIREIAKALGNLAQPFIWSLKERLHQHLPPNFQPDKNGHASNKNGLVLPWTPQKLILSHPAVGCFVSHCGWNSTLEAMSGGKPMVCWPQFADQLINAETLVERNVGYMLSPAGVKMDAEVIPASKIEEAVMKTRKDHSEDAKKWGDKFTAAWDDGGSSHEEFLKLGCRISESADKAHEEMQTKL